MGDLERVDLGSGLPRQLQTLGPVGAGAHQNGYLDPGSGSPGARGRIYVGEGSAEADDGGVLDQDVGEAGELGGEAIPRRSGEVREGVGDAEAKELDELGGEPLVEPVVAEDRVVGDAGVVGVAEPIQGALDLGAGIQNEGEEEGHGVELAIALDEPALPREATDLVRREEVGESVEDRLRVEVLKVGGNVRTGAAPGQVGGMRHPTDVGTPSRAYSVPG